MFWHYLANNTRCRSARHWFQPINWRGRHLVWYLLLFVISLWLQLGLPDELSRFTPFCLALPIIALARHYGWQGALIATLMNAIALIASQTRRDHPVDLLLSLLVQSLTGLLLGAGIQRLRELNQSLQRNWRAISISLNGCWKPKRACAAMWRESCTMISVRPSLLFVLRLALSSGSRRITPA